MSKVRVQGKEYELRIDLAALKKLSKKTGGGIRGALNAMANADFENLEEIFAVMANCARGYNGQKQDVKPEDIEHATLREVGMIADAIKKAQEEAFETETVDGEADDEHHDDILEQIEAEEAKNGETGEG